MMMGGALFTTWSVTYFNVKVNIIKKQLCSPKLVETKI